MLTMSLTGRLRREDASIEEMISLSKVSDKLLNKLVYDYMFRCVIKLRLAKDAQAPMYALRKTIALRQSMLQGQDSPRELHQLHAILGQKIASHHVHPCTRLAWAGTFSCPKESILAILREVSGWTSLPWEDAPSDVSCAQNERFWLRERLATLLEKVEQSHGHLVAWLEKPENKEKFVKVMMEEGVQDSQQAAQLLLRVVLESQREKISALASSGAENTETTPSAEYEVLRAA
ncbi:MAG: hypothetical protein H6728_01165 [Myxococcales bacterium]|nr:hypothetical protein [Myxococcales bacterium]MCB9641665.1 hypothetical protein [Myxococcales bacterium]